MTGPKVPESTRSHATFAPTPGQKTRFLRNYPFARRGMGPQGATPPTSGVAGAVTPEQLAKERKASIERQRRQLEKNAAERLAQEQTNTTKVLTRAQRLKLRDDEYVPPQD